MLLKLDLQRFSDGEDETLDFDSMLADFESEWNEEDSTTEETVEQEEETQDDTTSSEEETQEETKADPNDSDESKRNRAFADLRRQAEENKRYADFIAKLAEQGGTTPEDILKRYEDMQLEQQAEKEKVPVEMLKRQTATESELAQLKEQLTTERLNTQVDAVKTKYNITDDDVKNTFQYMFESGVDPRTTPVDFEKFYRAANLDTIIQKEVEAARQKDLEDKKARQEAAAVPNGNSATQTTGDLSDEEVDALLAKMGIRI
jgi:hypothetical protein